MITELSLENFKSWRRIQSMRLAPTTGVFGKNSSGKTSIAQLLLLLKQTMESSDRSQPLHFGGGIVSLGSIRDLAHQHKPEARMSWSLRWTLPEALRIEDTKEKGRILFEDTEVTFEAEVAENSSGRVVVDHFSYVLAKAKFDYRRIQGAEEGYEITATAPGFAFRRARGRPWPLPEPVKCYGFPNEVNSYFQNAGFLGDFELAFSNLFSRLYYLGPLREYPKREYPWTGSRPPHVGLRGEQVVEALLSARSMGERITFGVKGKKGCDLDVYVAEKLKNAGLIHKFSIREVSKGSGLYRVHVQVSPHGPESLITDVGFGVSQVLPVVTLCYYAPRGSVIMLEQPEIHLHPSAQSALADMLIDAVKAHDVQIIVESHSEHLLRRLQRRVADGTIGATDAALYFCDTDSAGASRLVPLNLDEFGAIANWPKDFFGDEFGEIAATMDAVMRRKEQPS